MIREVTTPSRSAHSFHIPVMGTGFTVDTPLKVARYGISSVVSLVDDVLIEGMRRVHCRGAGEEYEEIKNKDEDSRARRITSYLNLLHRRVGEQMRQLRAAPFEPGSEIVRYYEMLPDCPGKRLYRRMVAATNPEIKERLEVEVRRAVKPGSIDVNIMTKLDRDTYRRGVKLPPEFSDALSALRGFAKSALESSIVLSAGMNRRLYTYMANFDDFFPDGAGRLRKRIILKVSDFRSASVQGRFLAKLGLWVSEFRMESGLNCGGHAFATQGQLAGPILDEFRRERRGLADTLFEIYRAALEKSGRNSDVPLPEQRFTVQGGIGTHEEQELLLRHFEADGTGWATPFLLVPEVSNVDDEHRAKLAAAGYDDVFLSESSPLGIPFWNLRNSASEEARRQRIQNNAPGSPCPKGFLVSNTEFSKTPICHASRAFQKRKLAEFAEKGLPPESAAARTEAVLAKSCICHDLAGTAPSAVDDKVKVTPAICCGPNIVNFDRTFSLEEMIGHIYGEKSILKDESRPHMFIRELTLYVEFLARELDKRQIGLDGTIKSIQAYRDNLLEGVEFYRAMARDGLIRGRERFLESLTVLAAEIESMAPLVLEPVG